MEEMETRQKMKAELDFGVKLVKPSLLLVTT